MTMNTIVKLVILTSILVLAALSCQNPDNKTNPSNSESVTTLALSTITDTTDLAFSLIGERVEIIPLETTPDAFIGGRRNTYVLNDEFIVVESDKRLLLFKRDGSFNKVITKKGKGPGEYVSMRLAHIYDDVLWYSDAGKQGNGLSGIDLTTGEFHQLQFAVSGRIHDYQFVSKDHILYIADSINGETIERILYEQDSKGRLIAQTSLSELNSGNRINTRPYKLLQDDKRLILCNSIGDSIFHLDKSHPSLDFHFDIDQPTTKSASGHRAILLSIMEFNKSYLLSIKRTALFQPDRVRYAFPQYFYLNRISGAGFYFENIAFEDWGFKIPPIQLDIEEGKSLVFAHTAIGFQEMAQKALNKENLPDKNRKRLEEILNTITEEDNPILVIGMLRQ